MIIEELREIGNRLDGVQNKLDESKNILDGIESDYKIITNRLTKHLSNIEATIANILQNLGCNEDDEDL